MKTMSNMNENEWKRANGNKESDDYNRYNRYYLFFFQMHEFFLSLSEVFLIIIIMATNKSMIVIDNLPNDINLREIRPFLNRINIQVIPNGGIRIIPSIDVNNSSQQRKQTKLKAYVIVENDDENVEKAIEQQQQQLLFRNQYPITISKTNQKVMEKEFRYIWAK